MPRRHAAALTHEELAILEENNLILPLDREGRKSRRDSTNRKVSSVLCLPNPTSFPSEDAPSSVTCTRHSTTPPSDTYSDLPLSKDGVDVLQYIGLTLEAAQQVHRHLSTVQHEFMDREYRHLYLLDWVAARMEATLNAFHHPTGQYRTPATQMRIAGISQPIIDAILNPEFKDIFETEKLFHWVMDTLESNYRAMEEAHERLKETAHYLLASSSLPHRTHHTLATVLPPSSTPPVSQEDCITLYKPLNTTHRDSSGWRNWSPSNFSFDEMLRRDASDFAATDGKPNLHLYADRETAEHFRRYTASRCRTSETCILEVRIPRVWMTAHPTRQLEYGALWREYVFSSREGQYQEPNAEVNALCEEHVLAGPISRCFENGGGLFGFHLKREDVEREVTREQVVKRAVGGAESRQVVIREVMRRADGGKEEVMEGLEELVRRGEGGSHLDVYAAVGEEGRRRR